MSILSNSFVNFKQLMTNLPVADDLILDRRQLLQPHWPSGMQLLRADADLSSKAKLTAIRKPC